MTFGDWAALILTFVGAMFFFAGTRDTLCDLALLKGVLQRVNVPWDLQVIDGGNHSFDVAFITRQPVGLRQNDQVLMAINLPDVFDVPCMIRVLFFYLGVKTTRPRTAFDGIHMPTTRMGNS